MSDGPTRFRLHLPHGAALEGFTQADGTAVAIDDAEYGLASAAPTPEDLLRGYDGLRIEWTDTQGGTQ